MMTFRLFLNTRSGSAFFRSLNMDESDLVWEVEAESEDAARRWALSRPGIVEVVRVEAALASGDPAPEHETDKGKG